jgi:hypothetical protein
VGKTNKVIGFKKAKKSETGKELKKVKKFKTVKKVQITIAALLCIFMLATSAFVSLGRLGNISAKSTAENNKSIDDNQFKSLKKLGYKDADINQCKLIIERVKYQLEDIVNSSTETDISAYKSLYANLNEESGILYMLKLKKEFGGYDKVLDEYLCSLQLKLELSQYTTDKKAYLKQKKNKEMTMDASKLITIEKIEQKSIEIIQEQNKKNNTNSQSGNTSSDIVNKKVNDTQTNKNENMPSVQNDKPADPARDAMKEINEIKQKSFNGTN